MSRCTWWEPTSGVSRVLELLGQGSGCQGCARSGKSHRCISQPACYHQERCGARSCVDSMLAVLADSAVTVCCVAKIVKGINADRDSNRQPQSWCAVAGWHHRREMNGGRSRVPMCMTMICQVRAPCPWCRSLIRRCTSSTPSTRSVTGSRELRRAAASWHPCTCHTKRASQPLDGGLTCSQKKAQLLPARDAQL